jgi:hypothetical protein
MADKSYNFNNRKGNSTIKELIKFFNEQATSLKKKQNINMTNTTENFIHINDNETVTSIKPAYNYNCSKHQNSINFQDNKRNDSDINTPAHKVNIKPSKRVLSYNQNKNEENSINKNSNISGRLVNYLFTNKTNNEANINQNDIFVLENDKTRINLQQLVKLESFKNTINSKHLERDVNRDSWPIEKKKIKAKRFDNLNSKNNSCNSVYNSNKSSISFSTSSLSSLSNKANKNDRKKGLTSINNSLKMNIKLRLLQTLSNRMHSINNKKDKVADRNNHSLVMNNNENENERKTNIIENIFCYTKRILFSSKTNAAKIADDKLQGAKINEAKSNLSCSSFENSLTTETGDLLASSCSVKTNENGGL